MSFRIASVACGPIAIFGHYSTQKQEEIYVSLHSTRILRQNEREKRNCAKQQAMNSAYKKQGLSIPLCKQCAQPNVSEKKY